MADDKSCVVPWDFKREKVSATATDWPKWNCAWVCTRCHCMKTKNLTVTIGFHHLWMAFFHLYNEIIHQPWDILYLALSLVLMCHCIVTQPFTWVYTFKHNAINERFNERIHVNKGSHLVFIRGLLRWFTPFFSQNVIHYDTESEIHNMLHWNHISLSPDYIIVLYTNTLQHYISPLVIFIHHLSK